MHIFLMCLIVFCVYLVACSDRYGEVFGWLTAAGLAVAVLLGVRA